MSVSIRIGTTNDAANVMSKTIEFGNTIQANLKQPCSVETPVFILKTENHYITDNYLYCEDFKRYYYITDVNTSPGGLVSLTCTIDVLKTYEEQIRNLQVNVSRTETEFSNVVDTNLVTTANDEVVFLNFSETLQQGLTPAPSGSRTFLLITTG